MITETKEYKDWLEREAWNHPLSETNFKRIARKSAIKAEQLLDRDSFAMEFAEWCVKSKYTFDRGDHDWQYTGLYGATEIKETHELLEIFKKQQNG